MKKKLMTLSIALGLSLAVLTGCGKPTVESLVDGMYDSEIESQTAEVEMDIALSVTAMGLSFDVTVGGDLEVQTSGMNGDDQTSYIDGEITMKAPAGSIDEKMGFEAYAIVDDGTVTSYSCVDNDGVWYKTEVESDDSDALDQDTIDKITEAMKDVLKENGELAEDTEKVEGEECYVLTATIEGDDWSAILKPMRGMLDDAMEEAGVDIDVLSWFEYFSADITYYISKDTGYLVKAEMDMSDTDIYGMVGQIMKDSGAEALIGDFEDMIEEISFSKFYVSAVYSDINDTEIKIPDDVIDNAVMLDEAGAIDGLMGGITGNDPIETDPIETDPIETDPIETNPSGSDEWFHGDSFTLNKCDEYDEFLCEVKIPDGYSYDGTFSDPEGGLVSLDREDGNGWIWVQNEAYYPTYAGLLNGELDDDSYENYKIDITVIGTAFGGSDVMLVEETYTNSGYDYDEINICIKYDDGGFAEFLTVDCNSLYDLDDWTEDDFLDLAVSLFGR
ncbi:MAG: hypothetical protein K2K96_13065 [Lachnospiraceae bacterium]|nr:hypothetical protein [Lachnospiraceae bacterium]